MRNMKANRKLPSHEIINISTWPSALVIVITKRCRWTVSFYETSGGGRVAYSEFFPMPLSIPSWYGNKWPSDLFADSLQQIKTEIAVFWIADSLQQIKTEIAVFWKKERKLLLQFWWNNWTLWIVWQHFSPVWFFFFA